MAAPVHDDAPSDSGPDHGSTPPTTTGTTVQLSALGADDQPESQLTYQWNTMGGSAWPLTYSANGTNGAKTVTVTFTGADCGMLLFADAKAGVVGACHAGWKGALSGVIEATIAAMERLGARRTNTIVALGPTIGQASYEVGPEFFAQFVAQASDHARFFAPSLKAEHRMFDLPGFIGCRVERAGVGSFENLGLDTYADETRFFSYRRTTHRGEPDYGRLVSAIAV